ncbi:hypothetical protein T484DRAFT_1805246 [Baffinella frigidus]|nr:hypothetical protein T484DRAFT_1805246 [Cryptophyta sp. CCMP2293]
MARVPEWLKSAGLAQFASNFNNCDEDDFLGLQMQDYANYKIVTQEDRRKLFSLLQVLKRELDSAKPSGGGMKALPSKKHAGGGGVVRASNPPVAAPEEAPVVSSSGDKQARIKVCVRKRPLFRNEQERGDVDVIEADNVQSLTRPALGALEGRR